MLASLAAAAALVLAVSMLTVTAGQAADTCSPDMNRIACENTKPGTSPDEWDIDGAGDDSIQGFATDISVNVGQRVDFKIDTDARAYTIDIYRTGWYQGLGARKVTSVTPSAVLPQRQPACLTDVSTELVDCGAWALSAGWNVPADAVSGVYFALLTRTDTGGTSHITFIVRDESSRSDVLFQTSDPTWHAYNAYGGSDFYQGAANGRAFKISYNRPFATRGGIEKRDFYFGAEYPMVRFLEKNGYDVSYFSGVDTDRLGGLLKNHKVFLSVGHDEYWSGAQRANIEAARDAGVNLQFLSGNEGYWRTRYEPSSNGGNGYRTLVSYKETWSNSKIDPAQQWTGTWRDPRYASQANGAGLPENSLTGTAYMVNSSDLPVTVSAAEGKYRLWRNTELASLPAGSSRALAAHTVGYESNEDVDNGFRPQGLVRLSTTQGAVPEYLQDFGNTVATGQTTHHVTLYRAASGALVFSAGSVQWSWGLDQVHDGDGAPADPRMQQAEVNLLADMGAQPATLDTALTKTAASTDKSAPSVTITTPPAAQIANGSKITVTGTALDAGGGRVAGVEYSPDGGTHWYPAQGTDSWSFTYYQAGMRQTALLVRAIDDSGNYPQTPASVPVNVSGPYSVFGAQPPKTADSGDASPVELGLRFTAAQDGFVSGVRFFKSQANTGTHAGSLWDLSGNRLAQVTFANETASGWQSARFARPIEVRAGTEYVVSYSTTAGHYSAEPYFWSYFGRPDAPLQVNGGFGAAPAGLYSSVGGFPASSYQQGNYYVDAVFDSEDDSPLTAHSQTPADTASSVPVSTEISAVLTKTVDSASVKITLKDAAGAGVAGSTAYSAVTRKAVFTPDQPLARDTAYTATLAATDALGNSVSSGGQWSFRTVKPDGAEGVCPCSLYTDSTTPGILSINDGTPLTLGVRFAADTSGKVTGVRFYKAAGNTGTHTGKLFTANGTELASATFSNETASGWQQAEFSQPVSIQAGTEYIASYTSTGTYSATIGGFGGNGFAHGPLHVAQDSGQYTYSGSFPTAQSSASYLVDVAFTADAAPIRVSDQSPAAGAADVAADSAIAVTLSQPVADGYALRASAAGNPVAGTVTRSTDGRTLTLRPDAPLPAAAAVDVSLTSVSSSQGAVLPDQTWSFTVASVDGKPTTLLGNALPQVKSSTDRSGVELGVTVTSTKTVDVTAIRFYKGVDNGGTHTGSLWDAAGRLLANVTFGSGTGTGWQTAALDTPVTLEAGQRYTASYYAPQGGYSYTGADFAPGLTVGPLTVASDGGKYRYGAGGVMPDNSWNSTNYFVDLVFADSTAPATMTMFGSLAPEVPSVNDTSSIELGVAATPAQDIQVQAIKFYKGVDNTGTHTGSVWNSAGERLATVTFANESASGWQSAALDTPLTLKANQQYTISYYAPNGGYSATGGYFSNGWSGGLLTADSANGKYRYGSGGVMPESSLGTNYFVDLVYTAVP